MKIMRIIVAIIFVIVSIVAATVFVSETLKTDKNAPVINISGEVIDVSIKATNEDLLAGVTAYDKKDKDLTGQVIVESISRFTEKGVCKVTYAVCDSDNNIAKATRKIRYTDYSSPRFTVTGNLCFSMYEIVDIREFIHVNDCLDGNITSRIITTSENYSSTDAGFYTIKSTVTNSKGDYAEIELPLIVEDRPLSSPKIELSEYLIYVSAGQRIELNSYIVDALTVGEESIKDRVVIESTTNVVSADGVYTATFAEEGTYHVHYYATDANGYRGHSVMTVIVGGQDK